MSRRDPSIHFQQLFLFYLFPVQPYNSHRRERLVHWALTTKNYSVIFVRVFFLQKGIEIYFYIWGERESRREEKTSKVPPSFQYLFFCENEGV